MDGITLFVVEYPNYLNHSYENSTRSTNSDFFLKSDSIDETDLDYEVEVDEKSLKWDLYMCPNVTPVYCAKILNDYKSHRTTDFNNKSCIHILRYLYDVVT